MTCVMVWCACSLWSVILRMWRASYVLSSRLAVREAARLCSSNPPKPSSTSSLSNSHLRRQAEKQRRRKDKEQAILSPQHCVSKKKKKHNWIKPKQQILSFYSQILFSDFICCFQTAEEDGVKWSEKQRIVYTAQTPPGTKKGDLFPPYFPSFTDLSKCDLSLQTLQSIFFAETGLPFPSSYSPEYVESCWYEWWEKEGFFSPKQHVRYLKQDVTGIKPQLHRRWWSNVHPNVTEGLFDNFSSVLSFLFRRNYLMLKIRPSRCASLHLMWLVLCTSVMLWL